LFLFLSYFGCDQSQVQRYLAAASVDAARWSLLLNAFVKIPLQAAVLLIGVLMFVFYVFAPPPLVFAGRVELADETARQTYTQLAADYALATNDRRQAALRYVAARREHAAAVASAETAFLEAQARCDALHRAATELLSGTTGRPYDDTNHIFPTFVLSQLPTGLVGLMLAAIFAAAMSTSAGELNALATTTALDMYHRWWAPEASEAELVRVGRLATVFWGGWACVGALYATHLGSLIEVVNRFGSWFYGSLLGVFVLAVADPRAHGWGAVSGLLLGMGVVWVLAATDLVAFLWLNAVGCLVTFVVGVIVSRIRWFGRREKQ
jgi:Na+/proline symporter